MGRHAATADAPRAGHVAPPVRRPGTPCDQRGSAPASGSLLGWRPLGRAFLAAAFFAGALLRGVLLGRGFLAAALFAGAFFVGARLTAFLAAVFLAGALFAGAFLAAAFFAGAFFAGAFLTARLAAAFFAGAFLAGAFLAGAFFATAISCSLWVEGGLQGRAPACSTSWPSTQRSAPALPSAGCVRRERDAGWC